MALCARTIAIQGMAWARRQRDDATMKLIESLRAEHALIDPVLGAFRTYVERLATGAADVADGGAFLRFFALFVGQFHDEREEQVLFEALVDVAELPRERGPIHAITQEHIELNACLRRMAPLLERGPQTDDEGQRLRSLATHYTQVLWRHIDAENSVLYVEGEERLARYGIAELPDRPPSAAEAAAQAEGAVLLQRYPPLHDLTLTRGDGCYLCRAHGRSCDGLEAEWWSELEWDDFHNR
jgi:hemerythrin-like domain-containing protein